VDRLSTVDSSFLRVETPTAHMHVGWLSFVELPSGVDRLDGRLLKARIAARLHLAPRFRQRVVKLPLSATDPVWDDAADFEIGRHVRISRAQRQLSAPDARAEADEFLSRPLDRDHPLWQILVIPRVRGGRAALVGKVHHAMVDGVAAVELGMLMFDVGEQQQPSSVEWSPAPSQGALRLTIDSLADSALEQFRAARRMVWRSPAQTVRVADTMRRAAFSLVEDAIHPAPPSYLNPPIGSRRTLVGHRMELRRLLAVKRHHDATLNDVVLTVCTGVLRGFALRHGEEPHDLRVMVPVNVRERTDPQAQGNRISFAFFDLPVAEPSARDRLAQVIERMAEVKESGRIGGTAALLRGVGGLPEPLKERAARLAVSPRLYNLTVSNVPGPRVPLYAAGARVQSIYPVIPIADRHALAVGVLTYDGYAHFGVYADPEALPRVHGLPVNFEDALLELELISGHRGPIDARRQRRGSTASMRSTRPRDGAASER